ncbi:MAG TPA: hypothetical protein ENN90_01825, partial [Mariniphaga anaerophila]|nr:hypothetical protein [Mariniphaga anaerophila]
MKTIRLFFILLFIVSATFTDQAQKTAFFEDVTEEVQMARELYRLGKFNAAFRQFEKVQKQVDPLSELFSEAAYFKAVSALKAGHNSGYRLLEQYMEEYPATPFRNDALINLGDYQFNRKQYAAVLRTLGEVDRSALDETERVKLQYQNGYAHLMMDNTDQALAEFYAIKDMNNIYSRPATYYWAHIMYLQENYQSALDGFRLLETDPAYARLIPLY